MTLNFPIRSDKLAFSVAVREHLCHRETEFQTIDIFDTEAFGKVLLLDGHVQLAEFDEHAYHEALVHVPLFSVPEPKRALVVGGGDGGVLRELCKHDLDRIDMVEIDAGVVEASRQFLPSVSAGAFDNPRVKLHIADALGFVKGVSEPYDLIVLDITDVYEDEEGELSEQLFTRAFYEDCRGALSADGFLVTQADNLAFCPYSLEAILASFGDVFGNTGSFWALVPSFGGFSGYAWASHGPSLAPALPKAAKSLGLRYLTASAYELGTGRLPF